MTWISVLALLLTLFVKSPNLCEPLFPEILRVPVSQDCCEDENRASMLGSEYNIDIWQELCECLVVEWIMNILWKD